MVSHFLQLHGIPPRQGHVTPSWKSQNSSLWSHLASGSSHFNSRPCKASETPWCPSSGEVHSCQGRKHFKRFKHLKNWFIFKTHGWCLLSPVELRLKTLLHCFVLRTLWGSYKYDPPFLRGVWETEEIGDEISHIFREEVGLGVKVRLCHSRERNSSYIMVHMHQMKQTPHQLLHLASIKHYNILWSVLFCSTDLILIYFIQSCSVS